MDVAHILSLGIIFFLSGAAASQLPLSKAQNLSCFFSATGTHLFPVADGYFLFCSPFEPIIQQQFSSTHCAVIALHCSDMRTTSATWNLFDQHEGTENKRVTLKA
jgi:heme/copper-type cytochrome/quinol oxidase subunit 3